MAVRESIIVSRKRLARSAVVTVLYTRARSSSPEEEKEIKCFPSENTAGNRRVHRATLGIPLCVTTAYYVT